MLYQLTKAGLEIVKRWLSNKWTAPFHGTNECVTYCHLSGRYCEGCEYGTICYKFVCTVRSSAHLMNTI